MAESKPSNAESPPASGTQNSGEVTAQPAPVDSNHNHARRKRFIIWFVVITLLLALVVFIYWFFWWRFEVNTQDAYVSGNMVTLTPQIPGIVTAIYADNTQMVQEGDILVELDRTDMTIALQLSEANLGETLRTVVQMFERVTELKASVEVQRALLINAVQDYEHRSATLHSGAVSLENYQRSVAVMKSTEATLEMTEAQLAEAVAAVQNSTVLTHPLVKGAMDSVRNAWVQLQRCRIVSPATGLIAQRSVQVGWQVGVGMPLLAIIPLDQMWVDANYREVDLANMRIGQKTRLTADLWGGDVVYHGYVVGLPGGTGSIFSVLPPQNATGNWIKIVQRLPVRISLDLEELKKHPLRLGLSINCTVSVRDTQGAMVPPPTSDTRLYSTGVFGQQVEGSQPLIDQIVAESVDTYFLKMKPSLHTASVIEEESDSGRPCLLSRELSSSRHYRRKVQSECWDVSPHSDARFEEVTSQICQQLIVR